MFYFTKFLLSDIQPEIFEKSNYKLRWNLPCTQMNSVGNCCQSTSVECKNNSNEFMRLNI